MADSQYVKPKLVDHGTLAELTASNATQDMEDGIGKILNTDGASNLIP